MKHSIKRDVLQARANYSAPKAEEEGYFWIGIAIYSHRPATRTQFLDEQTRQEAREA